MYTVKVAEKGKKVIFRGKEVRTPAIFHRVTEKELKFLEVMLRAADAEFQLLEIDDEQIIQKLNKKGVMNYKMVDGVVKYCFKEIDLNENPVEEVNIEELFETDDTMGRLLKNLDKE